MKLAIPVKTDKENPAIAPLFGKAKWFAIIEDDNISIIPNNQSGGGAVIELFNEIKIDAMIIQEMGITPYERAKEFGMMIYHSGFNRILLNDLLDKFKQDKLEILDDTNIDKIIKHHEKKHTHSH